jgi:hypothetical protein
MSFHPKMKTNFLQTFVSTPHHIQVVSNNVKYSTDYFGVSRPSDANADIAVMRQRNAIVRAELRLQI